MVAAGVIGGIHSSVCFAANPRQRAATIGVHRTPDAPVSGEEFEESEIQQVEESESWRAENVVVESPKREFRATWLTTHYRIDWPSTLATNATGVAAQKRQLCALLDTLKAGNLNAVMLQVRPTADAFYQSSYEPWSHNLTGTRGQNPGYDPLQFAIEECHKRGMELHAWVNPFRYEVTANSYGNVDIRAAHPDWLLYYANGSYNGTILDPGQPVVRQYVCNVLMEMVNNYDVDGMIWDDYFYPYGGTTFEDSTSLRLYNTDGLSAGDWRRQNVNKTIEMIYDSIQAVKPWVRFGMAPFGIWTTKTSVANSYGITLPQGITGLDDYSVQFCDPVAWVQGGYVDYIAPQIYWPTTSSGQNYTVLANWWGSTTQHFSDMLPENRRVHFYSANNDYSDWVTVNEEAKQVRANRNAAPYDAPGAIFYNTNQYKAKGLIDGLKSQVFGYKALPPAMDWKSAPQPTTDSIGSGVLSNLRLTNDLLQWDDAYGYGRYTVYVYPKGYQSSYETSARYLFDIAGEQQISLAKVQDLPNKSIIVCVLDRYGNEFAPIFYNVADSESVPPIDTIHVTGISMRLTETTLNVGETIKMNPTVKPSSATVKTVTWVSSAPDKASVDSAGIVTAISNGDAVITGTTVDGGFQVSCTIHVIGGDGLDNVEGEHNAKLVMRNGVLYILRGDDLYDLNGRLINR